MAIPDTAPVNNPELVTALLSGDPVRIGQTLATSMLLLPASPLADGRAIAQSGHDGAGRRLQWAFTDTEALAAFDRRPVTTAVAVSGHELGRVPEIIALNPAGPGATLILAGRPEPHRPLSPAPNGGSVHSAQGVLASPTARAELRMEAREAHEDGRAALAADHPVDAAGHFERALAACGRLGDRLHGSATAIELAACQAGVGELQLALVLWERGADVLARFGETDLALEALLTAAEAAAGADQLDDADRLAASALELCAGPAAADRLAALWRAIDR